MTDEELDEHLGENLDLGSCRKGESMELRICRLLREAYWLGHQDGHAAGRQDGR